MYIAGVYDQKKGGGGPRQTYKVVEILPPMHAISACDGNVDEEFEIGTVIRRILLI